MTKQNVVVSDAKSGLNMAITVAVTKSALFTPTTTTATTTQKKPPTVPGTYITINKKKLLQNLEINTNSTRMNSWVDLMRASSPTHIKSSTAANTTATAAAAAHHHQNSWIVRHPSALDMFEQITNASKGKQIVMFLDYDGTLSPIVEDPDQAFMSDSMRSTVKKLAKYFPTAIVTGRCRDKVYSFVRLAELYYAGSHGMDIKGPSNYKNSKFRKGGGGGAQAVGPTPLPPFQPATEFLPMIDEVFKILVEKTKSISGAKVENNKFCLSVHFRCVDEKKWSELARLVKSAVENYPMLRLSPGRKVLEIRPVINWDKGKALEFLLESLGYANCSNVFPVYIGDDRTDEDAFKVLRKRGQGFGILVSKTPKETNASYSLQEPSEVMYFLERLVEWKKSVKKRQEFRVRRRLEEMKVVNPNSQLK